MNERIKLLAEQARHWAHFEGLEQNPRSSPDILFEQKFAELIVLKCAEMNSDPVVVLQHWGIDSKS